MTSGALRSDARRRALWVAAALVVLALLLLLLLRCPRTEEPPFDYFRAKAHELGRDPARVEAFVRDEIRTLSYEGNVKGALGALWHGSGSPEEKKALADALLAHCGRPAPAAAAGYRIRIAHRRLLESGPVEHAVYDGPIAALVGDVHSLRAEGEGKWRYEIRAPGSAPADVASSEALQGEETVFSVERPGRPEPLAVVRELWRRDNRLGPRTARAGDRHDFIVLPCRVTPYVREKEELLLRQRGRREAPEAKPYLALLDYARDADRLLGKLEKDLGVLALFEHPRILVWSAFQLPALPAPAVAIDLRLNRTAFEGKPADAYLANQARSMAESGLEQHFLAERTGLPAVSAFAVFSSLRDDYPNRVSRRLAAARETAEAVLDYAGADGEARFRAQGAADPAFVASRDPAGVRLRGGPVRADLLSKALPSVSPRVVDGKLDHVAAGPEEAALLVEAAFMAGGLPADYVLQVEIRPGSEPLVAPGSRFVFRWGEGEKRTEQTVRVEDCAEGLTYRWTLREGAVPATGTRSILARALEDARTHNPWYVMGPSEQKDATSFCLSRRTHADLKAGRPFEMTLEARRGAGDDPAGPRPVEWKGTVAPLGAGTHTVPVNGRPVDLPTLRVRIGTSEVAILDDPLFPVGMADRLVEVQAPVRGRVLDRKGLGVAGAELRSGDRTLAVTWVDGRFRLPAGPPRKLKLAVCSRGTVLGEHEVDTGAAGLEEVVLRVDRLRTELVWIGSANSGDLEALPVSEQVKRHARRFVEAGQLVVMPNREIEFGGFSTSGFYAFDPTSGSYVGVTEDGLHGATGATREAWRSALESAAGDLSGAAEELRSGGGGLGQVHMLRGAIAAWWIYSAYRVEAGRHEEAIVRVLREMDFWAEETNILSGVEKVGGKKLREKTGELMGQAGLGDPNSDTAALAFKVGYLGSTLFLANALGDE